MKLVNFKTNVAEFEAHLIRTKLEANGIACILQGEFNMESPINIQIPEHQMDKAISLFNNE